MLDNEFNTPQRLFHGLLGDRLYYYPQVTAEEPGVEGLSDIHAQDLSANERSVPPGLRSRSKEVKAGLQKGQQLSEQKPHRKWLGAARSQSRAH